MRCLAFGTEVTPRHECGDLIFAFQMKMQLAANDDRSEGGRRRHDFTGKRGGQLDQCPTDLIGCGLAPKKRNLRLNATRGLGRFDLTGVRCIQPNKVGSINVHGTFSGIERFARWLHKVRTFLNFHVRDTVSTSRGDVNFT